MKKISLGGLLAWRIAAYEASISGYEYIEVSHLVIGLCSLGKTDFTAIAKMKVDPIDLHNFYEELLLMNKALQNMGLKAKDFRRNLRRELRTNNKSTFKETMHRSIACKSVFKRGIELAANSLEYNCLHLLAASLEKPDDYLLSFLKKYTTKSLIDSTLQLVRTIKNKTKPVNSEAAIKYMILALNQAGKCEAVQLLKEFLHKASGVDIVECLEVMESPQISSLQLLMQITKPKLNRLTER